MTDTDTKPQRRNAASIASNVAFGTIAAFALLALVALTQLEGVEKMECRVGDRVTCVAGPDTPPPVEAAVIAVAAGAFLTATTLLVRRTHPQQQRRHHCPQRNPRHRRRNRPLRHHITKLRQRVRGMRGDAGRRWRTGGVPVHTK
jgi:hypothetical protein